MLAPFAPKAKPQRALESRPICFFPNIQRMPILVNVLIFVVSLTVLLKAADWFIDSAERIGLSLGISPFIIGVTIVAFGTSLPELATAVVSVLENESAIVAGTVIGSNVTNIALVLGLTTVIVGSIDLEYNIWHIDMPYLWGSAFMMWFIFQDYRVDLFECIICLIGIAVFLAYSIQSTPKNNNVRPSVSWKQYVMLVVGGVLVAVGSEYVIHSIVELSAIAGIDSELISLSAVALGTSLPEVIVSLNAARRGKASIAVGNVLGSNVFNTYVVIGIPALIGDLEIPPTINEFFLPLMLVMTILFGVISNNKKITRWEGALLLMFYLVFLSKIFAQA